MRFYAGMRLFTGSLALTPVLFPCMNEDFRKIVVNVYIRSPLTDKSIP